MKHKSKELVNGGFSYSGGAGMLSLNGTMGGPPGHHRASTSVKGGEPLLSPLRDMSIGGDSPLRPGTGQLKKRAMTPGGTRRFGSTRNKSSNRKRASQTGQNIRHMNTLAMLQKT